MRKEAIIRLGEGCETPLCLQPRQDSMQRGSTAHRVDWPFPPIDCGGFLRGACLVLLAPPHLFDDDGSCSRTSPVVPQSATRLDPTQSHLSCHQSQPFLLPAADTRLPLTFQLPLHHVNNTAKFQPKSHRQNSWVLAHSLLNASRGLSESSGLLSPPPYYSTYPPRDRPRQKNRPSRSRLPAGWDATAATNCTIRQPPRNKLNAHCTTTSPPSTSAQAHKFIQRRCQ